MSDLAATNCGCNEGGGCGSILWLIVLLSLCGGNGGFGGGCGGGCNGGCGGEGSNCIWIILLLLCCGGCGGGGSFC